MTTWGWSGVATHAEPRPNPSLGGDLRIGAGVTAAYVLGGWLGLSSPFHFHAITLLWPPSGIALAALIVFGLRFWWAVAAGAFLINLQALDSPWAIVIASGGSTLEAALPVIIMRRWRVDLREARIADMLLSIGSACGLGPVLAAALGVGSMVVTAQISRDEVVEAFATWWMGDGLGALIVGGLLLSMYRGAGIRLVRRHVAEAIAIVIGTGLLGVLSAGPPYGSSHVALSLLILMLAWAAVRFEFLGAAAVSAVSMVAAVLTLTWSGEAATTQGVQANLWELCTVQVGLSLAGYLLAASFVERRRALDKLRQAQTDLEGKVRQRSVDLIQTAQALTMSSAALKRSEAQFRSLVEHSAMGIIIVRDLRLRFFNAAAERLFGVSPETRGTDARINRFIAPHDLPRVAEYALRRRRGEAVPMTYELEGIKADGGRLWLLVSAAQVEWEDAPATLVTLVDQTDRRNAEVAMRQSEERFRSLAESLPGIIYETDSAGRVSFANKAAFVATGYTEDDVARGFLAIDLIDPDDRARALRNMQAVLNGEQPERREYLARRKDGSRFHILAYSLPILRDGRSVGLRGFLIDITERKNMEDALRRSNAELEQFASVASHDLRTPVNAIRLLLEVLEMKYSPEFPAPARDLVANACAALRSMDRTIVDLLDYSRVGHDGKGLEIMATGDALDAALFNLRADIEASAARIEIDGFLPMVYGNESELARLFQNLIGNAIKYRSEQRAPLIRIYAEPDGESLWRFTVADNGIGIPDDEREKIFGPFQRPQRHDHYAGTGIGLAVCRKVVERHGGKIWVESTPGENSAFHFTLRGETSPVPAAPAA